MGGIVRREHDGQRGDGIRAHGNPGSRGAGTQVEWAPHGVVATVLPFNWPVAVMANKVIPALLAGNTFVVKPPPTCPGMALSVAAAMAAVLPPVVLNVLNGPDPAVGAGLVGIPKWAW